jgi:hypothetical protein
MKRYTIIQLLVATILVSFGWVVGNAQTSGPAFQFVVDAPSGNTTITCVKGCELAWVERGGNARPNLSFRYGCSAPRCSSGRVGGWVNR